MQLSTVYETIKISQISSLMPCLTPLGFERRLVDSMQSNTVECRIDHRRGILHFVTNSFESAELRHKLSLIAVNMQKCVELIQPERKIQAAEQRCKVYMKLSSNLKAEQQKYKDRKALIDKINTFREQEREAEKQRQIARAIAVQTKADADLIEQELTRKKELEAKRAAAEKNRQSIVQALQSIGISIQNDQLAEEDIEEQFRKAAQLMGL